MVLLPLLVRKVDSSVSKVVMNVTVRGAVVIATMLQNASLQRQESRLKLEEPSPWRS